MTDVCTNTPFIDDATTLEQLRRDLADELARSVDADDREPISPLGAYTILFNEVPSPAIRHRVGTLYSRRSRVHDRGARRGYVYVFRDRRDRPATLVKIGSTSNTRRRMRQWRAALGATDDDLRLLFSFETRHKLMAELVVHALLSCQHDTARFNRITNERATEYFDVADWRALRQLVAAVTRHVSWWTREHTPRVIK